jgi:hypothetical protein
MIKILKYSQNLKNNKLMNSDKPIMGELLHLKNLEDS